MKARTFLVVSVLLNLVLAGAVAYLATNRNNAPPPAAPADPPQSAPATTPGPQKSAPALATVVTNQAVQLFDWRMVESGDYRKYIANLRSVGCPEETIRDIIVADVNKLFDQRRRESTASTNKFEYWKTGNVFAGIMDPDRIEKMQELDKEKRALLRALLGVDVELKPDLFANFNPFESMLDFLPSAKQNAVMDVYMKYQAKLAKAVGDGRGMGTDDMKDMQKVQKDMEAELASIMSPEDYREYQLRMSQTAMTMRMQLGSFEPSQKEFDKIFDARKAFDDEHGLLGGAATTREERDKRAAAQKEMNDQLKAVLGEERYAEYERAQDWNYQNLYRVTERYDLPKEAANKVYDMQKVAQQEAGKIRSDSTLSAEQKKQALADVRAETEKSIQVVLPEKAWDSYRPQAYWLNSISAEPRSTEAAPTP